MSADSNEDLLFTQSGSPLFPEFPMTGFEELPKELFMGNAMGQEEEDLLEEMERNESLKRMVIPEPELADDPSHRSAYPSFMDRGSETPSAAALRSGGSGSGEHDNQQRLTLEMALSAVGAMMLRSLTSTTACSPMAAPAVLNGPLLSNNHNEDPLQTSAKLHMTISDLSNLSTMLPQGGSDSHASIRRVYSTGDLQAFNAMEISHGGPNANHVDHCNVDDCGRSKIGQYTLEEREMRLRRYRQKRNERNFNKKIKYACRKTLADSRPRIRGRFARTDVDVGEAMYKDGETGALHYEDTDEGTAMAYMMSPANDMLNGNTYSLCNNNAGVGFWSVGMEAAT